MATVVVGLFGGNRSEHRIDLLVLILVGIVAVIIWGFGLAALVYRLFVIHEYASSSSRVLIGVPVLVAWTAVVVFAADWIVS